MRAGRDIVGQLVLRSANLWLGLVTTIVLVRTLGDDGFGQWATLLAIVMLAGSFGVGGLNNVAVERAAADPARSAEWVGALVTLRVLLTPVLTLASLAVSLAVASTTAMRVAAVIVHAVLLTAGLASARVVFQLRVRNASVSAVELAAGVAWAVAVVVLGLLGGGLVAVAAAYALVWSASNLVIVWRAFRAHPIRLRRSRHRWGTLVRLGLPVGLASLLALGHAQIAQVLVFEIAGDAEAGLYGAARRLYEPLHFLPASIMTTLFPLIVAARAEGSDRVRRLCNLAIDYLLLISLPALAIALAGPDELAAALFGDEFAAAGAALPVLMAAFVLIAVGHLAGYLIIAYGQQWPFVAVTLVALALTVAGNLVFVPRYGFVAAAWVTLATEALVVLLSMTMVSRAMHMTPRGVRAGRIVLAAAGAGALALALRSAGLGVVLWAGAAGVAYGALLLAVGALRLDELRALLRRDAIAAR